MAWLTPITARAKERGFNRQWWEDNAPVEDLRRRPFSSMLAFTVFPTRGIIAHKYVFSQPNLRTGDLAYLHRGHGDRKVGQQHFAV